MIIIRAGEEKELVYHGDFTPFTFEVINLGPVDAEICIRAHGNDINDFALYDSIYNEKRYWMTWRHNRAIIQNRGESDISVSGDGVFQG